MAEYPSPILTFVSGAEGCGEAQLLVLEMAERDEEEVGEVTGVDV